MPRSWPKEGRVVFVRLGLQDEFVMEVAPYPDILKLVGLDAESIAASAKAMVS